MKGWMEGGEKMEERKRERAWNETAPVGTFDIVHLIVMVYVYQFLV
jgi:hypothetical protein